MEGDSIKTGKFSSLKYLYLMVDGGIQNVALTG